MYYLPSSYIFFFFLFSFFHNLSCVSSGNEQGWCQAKFQCGNITAGFPFWGAIRPNVCGHSLLELQCVNNLTSLIISNHAYYVLHINQTSNTLRLARAELQGSFCNAIFTAITSPPKIYELLPAYKTINVFYLCDSKLPYRSSYSCPGKGLVSLSQNLDNQNSCQRSFPMNVPKSYVPEEKELNLTHLESALREGFEVKVNIDEKPCQECLSNNGTCGFENTKPICCEKASSSRCNKLHPSNGISSKARKAKIGLGVGTILFLFLVLTLFLQILRKRKASHHLKALIPQQKLKELIPLTQYSYAQVKRITKSFVEEIGKGGFGTVYRGTLSDGRIVAVKVLEDSKGNNGEDFINEVASMSQTSHVNIVTLLGFCSEGSKRAIIYEFMKNGSLDKFISSKTSSNMDGKELYGIALGVARGLEYLHHGCRTRIIHFDIKPQNVLLDDNFSPKVSDFGLAKLCERKESILSLLDTRGTIGYIAPEVFSSVYGRVSHKSDVYSYGMLVLEMIGARKKTPTKHTASSTSSTDFPEWIYKDLEKGENGRIIENGINSDEDEIAKKMTLVGLWCIQPWPSDRPDMSRVVEMMEGSVDALEMPPRPVLQCSEVSHLESSWSSEESSIPSEIRIAL